MSLGTCSEPRRAAARERRQERRGLVVHSPRRFYSDPKGRNRRLSCIFSLMRGWMPGFNKVLPTAFRFDNPFAEQAFPEPYQKLGPPPASLLVTHTVARVSDKAP